MPVPDGSWNGPDFQYTAQVDHSHGHESAPPCTHQEADACAGEASQTMAPRPPQADCNTAFLAPMWQYGMEHNQIESAGCVATHTSNNNNFYCNTEEEVLQNPEDAMVEGDAPTNH